MSIPRKYVEYTYVKNKKVPNYEDILQNEYKIKSLKNISTKEQHSILTNLQVIYRDSRVNVLGELQNAFEPFYEQMEERVLNPNHPGLLFYIQSGPAFHFFDMDTGCVYLINQHSSRVTDLWLGYHSGYYCVLQNVSIPPPLIYNVDEFTFDKFPTFPWSHENNETSTRSTMGSRTMLMTGEIIIQLYRAFSHLFLYKYLDPIRGDRSSRLDPAIPKITHKIKDWMHMVRERLKLHNKPILLLIHQTQSGFEWPDPDYPPDNYLCNLNTIIGQGCRPTFRIWLMFSHTPTPPFNCRLVGRDPRVFGSKEWSQNSGIMKLMQYDLNYSRFPPEHCSCCGSKQHFRYLFPFGSRSVTGFRISSKMYFDLTETMLMVLKNFNHLDYSEFQKNAWIDRFTTELNHMNPDNSYTMLEHYMKTVIYREIGDKHSKLTDIFIYTLACELRLNMRNEYTQHKFHFLANCDSCGEPNYTFLNALHGKYQGSFLSAINYAIRSLRSGMTVYLSCYLQGMLHQTFNLHPSITVTETGIDNVVRKTIIRGIKMFMTSFRIINQRGEKDFEKGGILSISTSLRSSIFMEQLSKYWSLFQESYRYLYDHNKWVQDMKSSKKRIRGTRKRFKVLDKLMLSDERSSVDIPLNMSIIHSVCIE